MCVFLLFLPKLLHACLFAFLFDGLPIPSNIERYVWCGTQRGQAGTPALTAEQTSVQHHRADSPATSGT